MKGLAPAMTRQDMSFGALLDRQTAHHGDKPFLTWYDDETNARVELSYRTLRNWVGKVANLLTDELGLEPGDRVVIAGGQHWQTAVALFGCWRAGLAAMLVSLEEEPSSDRLPGDPSPTGGELLDAARRAGFRALFVREEWLEHLPASAPGTVVGLGSGPFGRSTQPLGDALDFARVTTAMADDFGAADAPADADALVAGVPGLPLLSFANLVAAAAASTAALGLAGHHRMATFRSLADPRAIATGLLGPLLLGTGTVIHSRFPGERFWSRLAEERVTVAEVPAASLPAALRAPRAGGAGLPRVLAGGGLVAVDLARRWLGETSAPLVHGWGLPETAGYACVLDRADSPATLVARENLPVGRPVPGLELVVTAVDGTPVRNGTPGEVCVRGPAVSTRFAAPGGAGMAMRDGWLLTGVQGSLLDEPTGGAGGLLELTERRVRSAGLPYTPAS